MYVYVTQKYEQQSCCLYKVKFRKKENKQLNRKQPMYLAASSSAYYWSHELKEL